MTVMDKVLEKPRTTAGKLVDKFTHIVPKRRISAEDLRANLQHVEAMQLLMSLVHITGDFGLLDRFGPEFSPIDRAAIGPAPVQSVPDEIRSQMIEIAVAALDKDPAEQADYVTGYDLDIEKFMKMTRMAIGKELPDEFFGLYREQAGFVRPLPVLPQSPDKSPERIDMAILGAGMTGIAAAIQAADRGFPVRIFEASNEVGGVWNLNDYPGVGVDTPSVYYSLSFEINGNWQNYYPAGKEYSDYLKAIVDKYGLRDKIEFNSEVLKLEWIDADQEWELTVVKNARDREVVRAKTVMTALGHLNRPLYPDLPGRETFKGVSFHANRWKHDVDLKGKRVGIIGTGATGVQVIGKIAEEVGHLTIFQRQAMWIMPNMVGDGVVSDTQRWARNNLPYYTHWDRARAYYTNGDEVGYPLVRVDPAWANTHDQSISEQNEWLRQFALKYINECFGEGTELARKMTPNYAPMGKRPVRDPKDFVPGGFYYSVAQPHVDLEDSKLARVVPDGILTVDGKLIELDVIIYATGLSLDWLSPIEIIGRDGKKLSDAWRNNNPSTYIGGLVPGFPNFIVNSGPHTGGAHGGGHNFMAEVVNQYGMECLQLLIEEDADSFEVTREAFETYNELIDDTLAGSIWVWEKRAHTYYTNQRGRPILPVPFRHVDFWEMTRTPKRDALILR